MHEKKKKLCNFYFVINGEIEVVWKWPTRFDILKPIRKIYVYIYKFGWTWNEGQLMGFWPSIITLRIWVDHHLSRNGWGWHLFVRGEILRTSEWHLRMINILLLNVSTRLEISAPISAITLSTPQQLNKGRWEESWK